MHKQRFVSSLNDATAVGEPLFVAGNRDDRRIERSVRHSSQDLIDLTLLRLPPSLNLLANEAIRGVVAQSPLIAHFGA